MNELKLIRIFGILLALLIIYIGPAKAQQIKTYQPITSVGIIPSDFTSLFKEKVTLDKKELDDKESDTLNITKTRFLIESNYYLNKALLSGKILFNDPVSNYLNDIKNTLLKDDPELKKQIRIYTIKSPSVNAFATNAGIIFVNVGLVAQVENEAQIAYIISHEIVHYVKKHSMTLFVETYKGNISTKNQESELENDVFSRHLRSREMEMESDVFGLTNIYLKSHYSVKALRNVFDILQYSYLPFDEEPYDFKLFESTNYIFPDYFYLPIPNPIKVDEEFDDSKSTHPSSQKRRDSIMNMLSNLKPDDSKGQFFIQSKELFENIRTLCRYETIRQDLIRRNYVDVLYNCSIMMKADSENMYPQITTAAALYGIAKNRATQSTLVFQGVKFTEGYISNLYNLISKISRKEIACLALRYCWQLRKKYPENDYLKSMTDDLFDILAFNFKLKPSNFNSKSKTQLIEGFKQNDSILKDTLRTNKYSKIKQKVVASSFNDYAFFEYLRDTAFVNRFNYYVNKAKIREEEKPVKKKKSIQTDFLNISNVIIMQPEYNYVDIRKKEYLSYLKSEDKLLDFQSWIKLNAKIAKLNINILSLSTLNENEIEKYNEYAKMVDWYDEITEHEKGYPIFKTTETTPFTLNSSQYIDTILEKYHSSYLVKCHVVAERISKIDDWSNFIYLIVRPLLAPWLILEVMTPSYDTKYYSTLYDIQTGKVVFTNNYEATLDDRKDFVNSALYDTFYQIRNR